MKPMTSAVANDLHAGAFMKALTFLGIACLAVPLRASQRRELSPELPPPLAAFAAEARSDEGSDWQGNVSEEIRREEYSFQPVAGERETWSAPNRSQGFRTRISSQGVEVFPRETSAQESSSAHWRLSLRTVSFGRGQDLQELGGWSAISVQQDHAQIDHGVLLEWFENRKDGLEQGWNIAARPPGVDPLWIGLEFGGDRLLRIDEDGRSGVLVDASGEVQLRYGGLAAFDATGRELRARLAPSSSGVGIEIDDSAAIYPLMVDPVLSGPAWIAEGEQAFANLGTSLASAGDVNGDGYSDVIVGAPYYDNGQIDEGRAFLYLGSASGLAASPAWTGESEQTNAYFGYSVATAGDVNGDGYSDVVVGALGYSNGQTREGRAFVYLGSAAGLAASPAWTAESNQGEAMFGVSVASAGDVNGDGYSDVIVGAAGYDNGQTDEGRVYVYLGSPAGPAISPAWTAESDQVFANFGISVAPAGDANGDGYSDVILGASFFDNGQTNEGRAFVYLGSAAGLATAPAWTAESDQASAYFGVSVATAGDVNGDGYGDVIVGAYQYDNGETAEGRVFVYLGSPAGPAASPASSAESDQAQAFFGYSVATAGDVNGDGYSDVIVGAYAYDGGDTDEGRAYLYLGSAAGLETIPAWTAESNQTTAILGLSVATAGDVNGDGFNDVIVGAPYYDNGQTDEGRAFVYQGSADGLAASPGWTAESDRANAEFGIRVATAGDVNGDGYSDVVVGAYRYLNDPGSDGRAFLYLGSPQGLATAPAWTAASDQAGSYFGWSVATTGDVNGDGYSDVIVGAPLYDQLDDEGRVFLYLGSAGGLAASPSWTAGGDQIGDNFGVSVAAAGDVNGDGYGDVIVGAHGYDGGASNTGRMYLYLGSAAGLAASPSWTADGGQSGEGFGACVASAGDVNADGYSDVIGGAPWYSNGQTLEGRACLYVGSATGLAVSPSWTVEGDQTSAGFGGSVATAGDVNGDGYSDVVVGAAGYDNGQTDQGRAFSYLGSAAGLAASPGWTVDGSQQGEGLGGSVATAGDVNADGYSDVIVGASGYPFTDTRKGRAFLYLSSASGLATSAAWTAEGDQVGAEFGFSVAAAGDVNGDGYGDVIVGSPERYVEGAGGRAFVYLGNDGRGGWILAPEQRRTNGAAPIALLGASNSPDSFALRVGLERGLAGFTWASGLMPIAQLEWDVEELGVAFDGAGLGSGAPQIVDGSPRMFDELALGLDAGTPHHWRARLRTNNPLFPVTPWFTLPGNNRTETKLRTSSPTMSIFLPTGETTVAGTRTGSFVDTHTANVVYESIREIVSGGHPSQRYSYLEHKWRFQLTGAGNSLTLNVKAYRTNSTDGDSFAFAYSTDDVNYTTALTVTRTSDNGTYQTASLPPTLNGTVWIRVVDTDRLPGHKTQDRIFVDHMYLLRQ
jgi:hypothetical protein